MKLNFKEIKKMNKFKNNLKEIPIFMATDDNYMPFLAVSLESMLANCSNEYNYSIKILTTSVSEESVKKIQKYNRDNVDIEFVDVKASLEELGLRLHTCIYYTQTTYYRLFIPSLYPEYDKVLYLDCDIVVTGDISKLYNTNIGNNLVGATSDQFVLCTPKVHSYVTEALGFSKLSNYFNAGVLIMNLKEMREQGFEEQFVELLARYKFVVQDQDYLNIICKDKVYYVNGSWDKMPCGETVDVSKLNLIHYNLVWKPWHAEIAYSEEFWKYVDRTEYKDIIHNIRTNYTEEQYAQDVKNFDGFMDVIASEADNPNNYYNLFVKPNEGIGGGFVQLKFA